MTDLSEIKLLKVSEVAVAMRLSKMTVYRMIHSGELPAVKVGGSFRVAENVIHEVWTLAQASGKGVGQHPASPGDDDAYVARMPRKTEISLERHADIVRAIYREQAHQYRRLAIIDGHPGERGHRYYGERCVWCGVNYLDELIAFDQLSEGEAAFECGPAEGEWSDRDWPLDKVDALLAEHRARPS